MSADATARLDFLFAAAHTLLPASSALSALYLDRFRRFANLRDLQLPEPVTRTFCPQCAALFVPGDKEQREGCTVTVRSQRCDPRKKRKKNKETNDGAATKDDDKSKTAPPDPTGYVPTVKLPELPKPNGKTLVVPTATLRRTIPKTSLPSKHRSPAISTTQTDQTGSKRSKKSKSHRNVVDYDCHRCGLRTRFQGSDKVLSKVRNDRVSKKTTPNAAPRLNISDPSSNKSTLPGPSQPPKPSPISALPTAGSASSAAAARKRKKQRAGNSLLSMVAKNRKEDEARKQNENQNGDSPGGGLLAGFLSSL